MDVIRIVNGELETNSYLIVAGKEAIVIDPATQMVKTKVDDLGVDVIAIINTHGHFDHIGGNRFFSVPIYIHTLDAPMLTDPNLNLSIHFSLPIISPPANHIFSEDERLSIGPFDIEVIHTPGHTLGSISLRIDYALFTGDTLFKGNIGRTDLPGGDYEAMQSSLLKLASLPGDLTIYAGHGEITLLKHELESNPFLCELL